MRIGLPLLVALAIREFCHIHVTMLDFTLSVLWSLLAELIYYTFYPAFFLLKSRFGWKIQIALSFIAASVVVFSHPLQQADGAYMLFGGCATWVLGLPCWLLGCLLAETYGVNPLGCITQVKIWTWRLAIGICTCIVMYLQHQHSHHPIHFGYSVTLDFFAIPVFYWLQREIAYYQFASPWQWLERAGAGSYSLYLIHPIVLAIYPQFLRGPGNWLLATAMCVAVATGYYFIVEKPSHLLARRFRRTVPRAVLAT